MSALRRLRERIMPTPAVGYQCDMDGCQTPERVVRGFLFRTTDRVAREFGWEINTPCPPGKVLCPSHSHLYGRG